MSAIKKLIKASKVNDLHKIVTTVMAQGMLSVAHFAIGLTVAKYASKAEYGLYVLLFSFIGLFSGLHEAIISAPLMVLVNHKSDNEKSLYIKSLTVGRNYLLIPVLSVFTLCIASYNYFIVKHPEYVTASLVMIVVIMAYVTKEFYRTLHFTVLDTNTIFTMDILLVACVILGTWYVVKMGLVTALAGMVILGCSYSASYVYGKIRYPYQKTERINIRNALKENWYHGKWLIVGIFSSILKNRGYIYVVSAIIGLDALADVSAARLFLVPFILLYQSVNKIMVAKGSIMVANNEHAKLLKFLIYFMLSLVSMWAVYFLIVYFSADYLIGYLGDKYTNARGLIWLWGVYALVCTIRAMFGTGIIVYKKFKNQASYDILGTIIVVVSCVAFVLLMGNPGAILSLIAGEIIILLLYMKLFFTLGKDENGLFLG